MKKQNPDEQNHPVYRVDRFIVPNTAREEFISRVKMTHNLLKTLPGFVQDLILEQDPGDDEFVLITLVEWENSSWIANAKSVVSSMQQQAGYNPQELIARLKIKAELGYFHTFEFIS